MCAFYSSRILRERSARSGKTHLPSQSMCAAFVSTASSVGSGVRHSSLMHPEAWTCKTTAETRCPSLLLHASDPCKYCGKSAKQPRRHPTHCRVLFQASLAGLHAAQAPDVGDDGRGRPGPHSPAADDGSVEGPLVGESAGGATPNYILAY